MATTEKMTSSLDELRNTPMGEIPSVADWRELPIHETEKTHEPLVPLGIFSDHRKIFTSSVYADEHENSPYEGGLDGSLTALFVRESVAKRLDKAASLLPRGYHLMAMDTYRTLEVQAQLYEQYETPLRQLHPDWSDEQIHQEVQRFVSKPSDDPSRPSPHNTGASVDVVITKVSDEIQDQIDEIDQKLDGDFPVNWREAYLLEMKRSELLRRHSEMLDFGTPFDFADGGPTPLVGYYEQKDADDKLEPPEWEAAANRRMLYHVMTQAGFEPYEDEWWHYNDPASQMGAKAAGRDYAEYGAIELSPQNKDFLDIRRLHAINSARHANGEEWIPPHDLRVHYELGRHAAIQYHPRHVAKMSGTVAKISPSKAA